MTNFKLVKKSTGAVLTVFHVMNGPAIVGSINVRPDEEKHLLRHWRADAPPAARASIARPRVEPVRLPKLSRQAILRGC
jgi:hypothetical protein